MKSILVLSLIFISYIAYSQELNFKRDVIVWEVNKLTDTSSDSTITYRCQFITDKSGIVKWLQEDGDFITKFKIQSSNGDWLDFSKDGARTLAVTYLDKKGSIQLSGKDGVKLVKFEFIEDGENTLPFIFHVSSISKL
ncbi:MAG: hypothetical protein HC819_23165 [Cyclobacteriaceae bacterium]|nr:hypothetical protein [Cyclobacteriaceae bacterium]